WRSLLPKSWSKVSVTRRASGPRCGHGSITTCHMSNRSGRSAAMTPQPARATSTATVTTTGTWRHADNRPRTVLTLRLDQAGWRRPAGRRQLEAGELEARHDHARHERPPADRLGRLPGAGGHADLRALPGGDVRSEQLVAGLGVGGDRQAHRCP